MESANDNVAPIWERGRSLSRLQQQAETWLRRAAVRAGTDGVIGSQDCSRPMVSGSRDPAWCWPAEAAVDRGSASRAFSAAVDAIGPRLWPAVRGFVLLDQPVATVALHYGGKPGKRNPPAESVAMFAHDEGLDRLAAHLGASSDTRAA